MELEPDTLINVHSIRLFPKSCGANAYQITGIAARCDYFHRNVDTSSPRHIFLSMRSPFVALKYFTKQILPTLNSNFILITGSEDITIPNQCDRRKLKFNIAERLCINQILNNPYLSHWFCENLDGIHGGEGNIIYRFSSPQSRARNSEISRLAERN